MKTLITLIAITMLSGCATAVAIVDVTGETFIYTGRTVVRAFTPSEKKEDSK